MHLSQQDLKNRVYQRKINAFRLQQSQEARFLVLVQDMSIGTQDKNEMSSSLAEVGERLADLETNWDGEGLPQPEDVQSDESTMLHMGLQALNSALSLALEGVDQALASQGGEPRGAEQLEHELEQLVEVLGSQVWLQSQQLYQQAFHLHRKADPLKAAQEDYLQLLATPLQEEYHPSARSLDSCIRCGAKLTADDRTFDGSYCEFCRTRWIQS